MKIQLLKNRWFLSLKKSSSPFNIGSFLWDFTLQLHPLTLHHHLILQILHNRDRRLCREQIRVTDTTTTLNLAKCTIIFVCFLWSLITFNKELCGAFFLPHHTAIRSIICQGAVVDGEVAHVANALKYVPWQKTGSFSVTAVLINLILIWYSLRNLLAGDVIKGAGEQFNHIFMKKETRERGREMKNLNYNSLTIVLIMYR